MKKLTRILHDLDQGNINSDEAEKQILELFKKEEILAAPVVDRRYFHEIPQEEVDGLIADKKTWNYVIREYRQPEWCVYPEALEGQVGCLSLVDLKKNGLRTKISREFCKTCEFFNDTDNGKVYG